MKALRLIWATLREIFDEAPYERFLQRNSLVASPAAYQLFSQERRSSQERRPRCC